MTKRSRSRRGVMTRKKPQTQEDQFIRDKNNRAPKSKSNREKKIMNSIANTTIILTSTMVGALTEAMMNTADAVVSGMAEAISGKEAGEKVNEEFKQKQPEVNEKIESMISEMRKDIYAQLAQKSKQIEPLLSDPAFDIGPKTIEKHDFKLPKLTEELDDTVLAQYTQLLVSEDPSFAQMFKELTNWMNTLPKFPKKTTKQ